MSFQAEVVASAECQETSIRVFRRFITSHKASDGTVVLDASKIISKECYQTWLEKRLVVTSEPERTFQRSLTAHLTSSDGRQPFLPDEEAAILKVVRVKSVW